MTKPAIAIQIATAPWPTYQRLAFDRRLDARLEALEPLGVLGPLGLDPVAHVGQALGAAREHGVEDTGDGVLVRLERRCSDRRVESSRSETCSFFRPPQDCLLGRHRRRRVVAAADQVEERGRELERPGLGRLAQERRHERGWALGRRRLLVLAVVVGPPLAAEDEPDQADDQERRDERRSAAGSRPCGASGAWRRRSSPGCRGRTARRRPPRGRSCARPVPGTTFAPVGRGEQAPREDDPQLDELAARARPPPRASPGSGTAS